MTEDVRVRAEIGVHEEMLSPSGTKRLLENMVSLGVLQAANYLLPLITLPYLVRVLGTERFGLVCFAQAFMLYFGALTDYGFNLSATRRIAAKRDDPSGVSEIFCSVLSAKVLLLALSAILVTALALAIPRFRAEAAVYYAAFLTVVGTVMFPVWYYQGMERMKHITALNVISRGIATAAIFVFVRRESDYVLATLLQSLGMVGAGVLGLATVRSVSKLRFAIPSFAEIVGTLRDGRHVFVAQFAGTAFGPMNVFVLGLLANNTTVGYYAIAEKIVRAVITLSIPITAAVYPRASALFAASREQAIRFLRRVLLMGGALFACLCVALFLTADYAVIVVAGERSALIASLIRIIAILPLSIFVDNIYGTQVMLNVGLERPFRNAVVRGALISLCLSLALIPLFGAVGSALAFLCSEIAVLAMMIIPVNRAGIGLLRVSK